MAGTLYIINVGNIQSKLANALWRTLYSSLLKGAGLIPKRVWGEVIL